VISWNIQKIFLFSELKGCKFVFIYYSIKFFKFNYYFSDIFSKKLKIDTSDGPWIEAVAVVKSFARKLNKTFETWRVNMGLNIPHFRPNNENENFLLDFQEIFFALTKRNDIDDQDMVDTHITTFKKEIGAFLESIQLLEIHAIFAAYTNSHGQLIVDFLKKKESNGYKNRTSREFAAILANKGFLGLYYKVYYNLN
jgi:hypothetical protein